MPDLTATIIGEYTATATGIYTRDNYRTFTQAARVFRLRLATSIDNTTSLRAVVLVSRTDAATLADDAAMTGVLLTQHARYGGASNLVNTIERNHDEGFPFAAGEKLGVFLLADSNCCTFAYALTIHYF